MKRFIIVANQRYYHGFSNRADWPLFHYLIDGVPVEATDLVATVPDDGIRLIGT